MPDPVVKLDARARKVLLEKQIIGLLLDNVPGLIELAQLELLDEISTFEPPNDCIVEHICQIAKQGLEISPPRIKEIMKSHTGLLEIGTWYIDECADFAPAYGSETDAKRIMGRMIAQWRDAIAVLDATHIDNDEEQQVPAFGWSNPELLTTAVEAHAYPTDALPEGVRAAVAEVIAYTQLPPVLAASSALAALSLAVQAHADVQRDIGLTGPVSIYFLTIADSGERKTTCDGYFTRAIRQFQNERAEELKPDVASYKADHDSWRAKREAVLGVIRDATKKGDHTGETEQQLRELQANEPSSPSVPRFIRGDDTPEALTYALAHDWPSSGVMSSEAGLIFGAHGMGRESQMRNLGLLNVLWDGGSHSVGRRTSDSFTLRGARLTISLQLQELPLRIFIEQSNGLARGMGFLARFLIAWPESRQGYRPYMEPPTGWPSLEAFNCRIREILKTPLPYGPDGTIAPNMLPVAPVAKIAWVKFFNSVESELCDDGELREVRDVASKAADNVARLAAVFHVFEHGPYGEIGIGAIESATRIVAWHLNEARRLLEGIAPTEKTARLIKLDKWLKCRCDRTSSNEVPRKDVQNSGPNAFREGTALDEALERLVKMGRVQLRHEGRRTYILVNPSLLGRTAS